MSPTSEAVLDVVDVDDAVRLTQEIVRIPSVVGEEQELSDALTARMRTMGYDEVYQQEALPGRKNVVGVVDSGRPGPTLVLTGHIDTKPVCVGWDEDPYGGRLDGDRLYGHAVMDMKAGIAGVVAAGAALARCKRALERQGARVAVSSTTWATRSARSASSRSTRPTTRILAELTDLDIYLGHRGRLYWDITAYGRAAHTCRRHDAVNSIARMAPLIEEIEALRLMPEGVPDWVVELVGPELYTAVGRIYGGLPPGGPSMIPDETTIRVDSRPHPGMGEEPVRGALQACVDASPRASPTRATRWCWPTARTAT